MSGLISEESDD
ncbi:hypothetical protein LINGRAHAP2_LOCUS10116 [Linum grandiflorum]